jgi:hypothetical protein
MDFSKEHKIETFRSIITISIEGLKIPFLINGGAVIAVLAYLGQSEERPELASKSFLPLGLFIDGVALTVLAFIGSYSTQFSLYNERVNPDKYSGPGHMKFFWVTVALSFLSIASFACGTFTMLYVFSK